MRISDWSSDVCSSDLTTACSTPQRTHSSTRVAQNVAWMSWGRLLPSRGVMPGHPTTSPSPRAASVCEDRFMLLHAERDGAGPPIVLVHGFNQTGRCWGPEAEDLADRKSTRLNSSQ